MKRNYMAYLLEKYSRNKKIYISRPIKAKTLRGMSYRQFVEWLDVRIVQKG